MAGNLKKDLLKSRIAFYESQKSLHPDQIGWLNDTIDKLKEKISDIEAKEALRAAKGKSKAGKAADWMGKQASRDADETIKSAVEKARSAQKKVSKAYDQSISSVGDSIKRTTPYRRVKWKAQGAKAWAGSRAKALDNWTQKYFPTFRGEATGAAKKAGAAASGLKKAGGAVVGAGKSIVTIGLNKSVQAASAGFWIFLTLILQVLDLFWLNFGGIDYKVLLSSIQAGGLEMFLSIVLPFYLVVVLIILLSLKYAKSRRISIFILVLFVPLIIINRYAVDSTLLGISLPVISAVISLAILIYFLDSDSRYNFLSWALLLMTLSSIFSLGGLTSGFHHIVLAFLVWFFLLKHPQETTWTRPNYIISVLLIIDFFGFGLWQSFGPLQEFTLIANRFVFPIWFLFVVFYTASQPNYKASGFSKFIMALVIIFYVIAFIEGAYGWANIPAQVKASPEEIQEAKSFFKDAFSKLKAFPKKIVAEYEKGMEEATAGYYQGKVEENQDPRNDLGVHIEGLEAADKTFYQDEKVIVWGDLKARTLDDPILVYMNCSSGTIPGTITPPELDKKKSQTKYEIEKLEQLPFECSFEEGTLKPGTNKVKVKAEFSFQTFGYLKTYLMDSDRIRALRREDIDPLKQYGIDKKPEAVYTNGPVKLGIGTVDPPIGLSAASDSYSYLGVTVQPQWYGQIKSIKEIIIQIPKGLDISDTAGSTYCNGDFEKLTGDELEPYDKEDYDVYRLSEKELKDIKKPIQNYKSWRCPITVSSDKIGDILGNTPVTSYYYRASVDYVYEIEKSISVFVKDAPNHKAVLLDCTTKCYDRDGCICGSDDKCGMPKGKSITLGHTCDNFPSFENTRNKFGGLIKEIDNSLLFIDAYHSLNMLCAQGITEEKVINDTLKSKGFKLTSEAHKDILRLVEECSYKGKKETYIRSGESKIVDKVKYIVDAFGSARSNYPTDLQDPAKK
ncbi:EpsG family protein, partial [Candidatus Woesearchaeota archaeon]|nr:EpsG family protein [Candidatus Woesearchaeota archaeon]